MANCVNTPNYTTHSDILSRLEVAEEHIDKMRDEDPAALALRALLTTIEDLANIIGYTT